MKRHATSIAELAVLFGRSPLTLQRYGHQGCPCRVRDKDAQGRYNTAAIRRWLKANGHLGKRPPNPNGRGAQVQADIFNGTDAERLRRAQAEEREAKAALAQIELKQREGELVSREEVEEHDRRRHLFMRRTLLALPRLAPTLAGLTPLEIQSILERKVEDIMRVFSGEADS